MIPKGEAKLLYARGNFLDGASRKMFAGVCTFLVPWISVIKHSKVRHLLTSIEFEFLLNFPSKIIPSSLQKGQIKLEALLLSISLLVAVCCVTSQSREPIIRKNLEKRLSRAQADFTKSKKFQILSPTSPE